MAKFNSVIQKAICDVLRQEGGSRSAACQHVDITMHTFLSWLRKGEAGDERYARFVTKVNQAEAEAKLGLLRIMQAAAVKDWRAADRLLIARWPDEFGHRPRKVEHSGPGGGAIPVNFAQMTTEQLSALAAGKLKDDPKQTPDDDDDS